MFHSYEPEFLFYQYAAFCHSACCCFLANRQRYKQSFLGQVRHFLPGASSPHGEHAPMEWRTYPTNCQGIQIGMHTQVDVCHRL